MNLFVVNTNTDHLDIASPNDISQSLGSYSHTSTPN